jgi:hypothetical protein
VLEFGDCRKAGSQHRSPKLPTNRPFFNVSTQAKLCIPSDQYNIGTSNGGKQAVPGNEWQPWEKRIVYRVVFKRSVV